MSKTTTLASSQITPTRHYESSCGSLMNIRRDLDQLASSGVSDRSAPVRCNCERGRTHHGYSHHKVGTDPSKRNLRDTRHLP
jgi:hypothetical protein